jgi:6-phosphofructokinase 2
MSQSQQSHIAVLALNPAVDISYEIPQLVADQKVRSSSTLYHPGGNGINVARGLAELGMDVRCCSVIAGESGDLLLRLLGDTLGDNHLYLRVRGETRLNATLMQQNPPGQFEVDSMGPDVPPEVLEQLTGNFLRYCGNGIAVLTGSTPPGIPTDLYRRLAVTVKEQGGRAVVDGHGAVLREALEAAPYLVRLNRYVLEMSIKRRLESITEVAQAAREIQARGVGLVCISLGNEGAVLVEESNSYHCPAPRVRLSSTVGAGDAMVAGMVAAAARGDDAPTMLRLGVICGSATASHSGTGLFTRDELETTGTDLKVESLDI